MRAWSGFLVSAILISSASVVHAEPVWQWEPRGATPVERDFATLSYDTVRGEALLFGGSVSLGPSGGSSDTNELWARTPRGWTLRHDETTAAPIPEARRGHAAAFDTKRGVLVVFGGFPAGGNNALNDVWEWNGRKWANRTAPGPSPRVSAAMAYDSVRERVVLSGGANEKYFDDLWEWDGNTWLERSKDLTYAPPATSEHSMVFDSSRGRIVMAGGHRVDGTPSTTWEWDGTSWANPNPTGPQPPYSGAHLAFDGTHVISYGGADSWGYSADTWSWDGTSWTKLFPQNAPSKRAYGAATGDPHGGVILFGGSEYSDVYASYSETWIWDGTTWTNVTPSASPPPRERHAMAFDETRQETVVFGGLAPDPVAETWVFDGSRWTMRTVSLSPTPRSGHAMVYDAQRGRVVLFGGHDGGSYLGDTWEWNGATWTQFAGASGPIARRDHTMSYDHNRQRVVLTGGSAPFALGDTWEWDGTSWTEVVSSSTPDARFGAAMASNGFLFGGTASETLSDTWSFDGSSWTQLATEGPSPRRFHALARASDAVVLFGGSFGTLNDDTWSWDGTSWKQLETENSPPARHRHGLVYDSARGELITFGGDGLAGPLGDTWALFELGAPCSPSTPCAHGYCVDGVCCGTSVCGACETCASPERTGICTPQKQGVDPDSCSGAGAAGGAAGAPSTDDSPPQSTSSDSLGVEGGCAVSSRTADASWLGLMAIALRSARRRNARNAS